MPDTGIGLSRLAQGSRAQGIEGSRGRHGVSRFSAQSLCPSIPWPLDPCFSMSPPWQLRPIIAFNREVGLNLLARAATGCLTQWARDQHDMRMGMVTVIHTFGGDLKWHTHVHLLVTEGGLSLDGQRWVRPYNLGWLISQAGVKKMWRYHCLLESIPLLQQAALPPVRDDVVRAHRSCLARSQRDGALHRTLHQGAKGQRGKGAKGSRARGTAVDEGKQGRKSIPSIPWPLGSFTPFWCATPVCLRRAGKLDTSRLRMRPWPGKTRRQQTRRQNPGLPRPHCCRGASGGWFTAPQILSCVLVAMLRCS